jgi:hypothetical protein
VQALSEESCHGCSRRNPYRPVNERCPSTFHRNRRDDGSGSPRNLAALAHTICNDVPCQLRLCPRAPHIIMMGSGSRGNSGTFMPSAELLSVAGTRSKSEPASHLRESLDRTTLCCRPGPIVGGRRPAGAWPARICLRYWREPHRCTSQFSSLPPNPTISHQRWRLALFQPAECSAPLSSTSQPNLGQACKCSPRATQHRLWLRVSSYFQCQSRPRQPRHGLGRWCS